MRTSQYLTDVEFTNEINLSLSKLDAILISKFDSYKITAILTNVVPNTNNVAIPSDFVKFRGLDIQYNGNTPDGYIKVRPCAFQKRDERTFPGTSVTFGPTQITYTLLGKNIVILPAALAGNFTYRLWYTPDYIPLVSATDTLQSYMDSQGWYDYAVCDVASKVATMQGMTDEAQILMGQSAEMKEHIIKLATPNRDAGDPKAIVDSRDTYSGNFGGYGWNW